MNRQATKHGYRHSQATKHDVRTLMHPRHSSFSGGYIQKLYPISQIEHAHKFATGCTTGQRVITTGKRTHSKGTRRWCVQIVVERASQALRDPGRRSPARRSAPSPSLTSPAPPSAPCASTACAFARPPAPPLTGLIAHSSFIPSPSLLAI